jgi:hypothetical protein
VYCNFSNIHVQILNTKNLGRFYYLENDIFVLLRKFLKFFIFFFLLAVFKQLLPWLIVQNFEVSYSDLLLYLELSIFQEVHIFNWMILGIQNMTFDTLVQLHVFAKILLGPSLQQFKFRDSH